MAKVFITELPPEGLGPGERPSLFKELVRFSPGKPRAGQRRGQPAAAAGARQHYAATRKTAGEFGSYMPDVKRELAGFMPSAIATPVGSGLGTTTAVVRVQRPAPISSERAARGEEASNEVSISELQTTWDAIEYFARGDGDTKSVGDGDGDSGSTAPRFVYLNVAQCGDDFRPYDLVVTDKWNLNPEHYTMSAQGMCHAVPGEESEFLSLAEWSANAIAYSQCAKIPFFRSYAQTKAFHSWNINVRYRKFCQKRESVRRQLFATRQSFAGTLNLVHAACFAIRDTRLLGVESRRLYDLADFEAEQLAIRVHGEQQVVQAIEWMRDGLEALCAYLEQQRKEAAEKEEHDDRELALAIESHKSMAETKREQKERARQLQRSISEADQIGRFIRMADITAVECMLLVATDTVVGFQAVLREQQEEASQGMFVVTVDMTSEGTSYSPNLEECKNSINGTINACVRTVLQAPRITHMRNFIVYLNKESRDGDIEAEIQSLDKLLETDVHFSAAMRSLASLVDEEYSAVFDHAAELEQFREMYNYCTSWTKSVYKLKPQSPESLQSAMDKVRDWSLLLARNMKVTKHVGIFSIDTRALKARLTPLVTSVLDGMKERLIFVAGRRTQLLNKEVERTVRLLKEKPRDLEEFSELVLAVKQDRSPVVGQVEQIDRMYGKLADYGVKSDSEHAVQHDNLHDLMDALQDATGLALRQVEEMRGEMLSAVERNMTSYNETLLGVLGRLNSPEFVDTTLSPAESLAKLDTVGKQLNAITAGLEKSIEYENQFKNVTVSDRRNLDETVAAFNYRSEFWRRMDQWKQIEGEWLDTSFLELDIQKMSETVAAQLKAAHTLFREFKEPAVLENLKRGPEMYQLWLPVLFDLGNASMQPRHWKMIFEACHIQLPPGMEFTLQELIQWKIFDAKVEVADISAVASGEWSLRQSLSKVEASMEQATFVLSEEKGTHILGGVDELFATLEENQMLMQIMRSSRFIGGVKQEVESWEKTLSLVSEVLDEWLYCQRTWKYLQSIFSVSDIQKQLPTEAADFKHVDLKWRDIMHKTHNNPSVLESTTANGVLDMFIENNEFLQKVQKSLDDYLETKRMAFPRFYFLSDDELIDILSRTQDAKAVQPHMRKLFSAIAALNFEPSQPGISAIISAMHSNAGELVTFIDRIKVRTSSNVEDWLGKVENMMKRTLYMLLSNAYKSRPDEDDDVAQDRHEYIASWPAMCVLTVEQIAWQEATTAALKSDDPNRALKHLCVAEKRKLDELANIIRGGTLSDLQRATIEALLTITVHARDVSLELSDNGTSALHDFEWVRQLRYYWEPNVENCIIRQVRASNQFGYEYLGNSGRLVITPLTDKCYLTLTNAVHMKLGGCPCGKAGTGKTETVKDLGKALARQVIVFNCSDGLDHTIMGRFFSGLSQAGAWACFDEFNRIELEVLSVVATQILTIQQALTADVERFAFEGRFIALNPNYGCFITMNPSNSGGVSYGGRSELPDNLKAAFRPVAMMIPDTVLIAKNMLYTQGFTTAALLARKVTQLYKLAAEQLSQQKHYDWELRAMKPVLTMAGNLHRLEPLVAEDVVLIRALRDSSFPKLVGVDLNMFVALTDDLFPGVQVPVRDTGALQSAIEQRFEPLGLVKVTPFVSKVIQLYETLQARHGVGIVGAPGTGKTTAQLILKDALNALNPENSVYSTVSMKTLNPKAITYGELYGEFNQISHEWTDGLVPALVRQFVTDSPFMNKWLVFDGPVDPVWIESMNTVLDDNKLLCLSNGERIQLPDSVNMIFEVEDLVNASPATVSRCGMVYFESEQLGGWLPIVKAWQKRQTLPSIPSNASATLQHIINKTLDFIEAHCTECVVTTSRSYVQNFVNMLDIMFSVDYVVDSLNAAQQRGGSPSISQGGPSGGISRTKSYDEKAPEPPAMHHQHFFLASVIFAHVWTFGANLAKSRGVFDVFAEELFTMLDRSTTLMDGFSDCFPKGSGVFNFYLDYETVAFKSWSEGIAPFEYSTSALEQYVPTVESTRIEYLLNMLMTYGPTNVMISGRSGVGKSTVTRGFLKRHSSETLASAAIAFNSQTPLDFFQNFVESRMDKRGKDVLGPASGSKMVFLVDDLSTPTPDEFGTLCPVEGVRQCMDSGGFYDRKRLYWKHVTGMQLIATCGQGGGHSDLNPRVVRHFHLANISEPTTGDLQSIFATLLGGWADTLEGISPAIARWISETIPGCVKASVSVFDAVKLEFLPTLSKSHYMFDIRDLLRLFGSLRMVMFKNKQITESSQFVRLWAHEELRIFSDRLVDSAEVEWFLELLKSNIREHFGREWDVCHFAESLFGDFNINTSARSYSELVAAPTPGETANTFEANKLRVVYLLNQALEDYNLTFSEHVDLVFFTEAINHIRSLSRVLMQPKGNMVLLGVAGSGRMSAVKFAAHLNQMKMFQIQVGRGYGLSEFREDLKNVIRVAAVDGKPSVFYLSESQITDERFLQDISDLLTRGEIPDLFTAEELTLFPVAEGQSLSRDEIRDQFAQVVLKNLHIIVALSPFGDAFMRRTQVFPALINSCTVEWYHAWGEEAYFAVARHHLSNSLVAGEIPSDPEDSEEGSKAVSTADVCKLCVTMTRTVNQQIVKTTSGAASTPVITAKFFVELVKLYQSMLVEQDKKLRDGLYRLGGGLTALKECNETVDRMQLDLTALQPQLAQMAQDTADLLVQIAADQEEADSVKSVVSKEQKKIAKVTSQCETIRKDAAKDLEAAMPNLQAAIEALNSLNKQDITEVKSFTKPPKMVMRVMEAVCVLKGLEPSWSQSQKVLMDMNFLDSLKQFDRDHVAEETQKALKAYVNDPDFSPEKLERTSTACKSICMWVIAIDKYSEVTRVVNPKKKRLKEAQDKLDEMQAELGAKMAELHDVNARVQALQDKYEASLQRRDDFESQMIDTKIRLSRAEKLTSQLGGERKRWAEMNAKLQRDHEQLVGNTLLAAGCIAYTGPFGADLRKDIIRAWIIAARSMSMQVNAAFSLQYTLGNDVLLREWKLQGLASDSFSIDNGLIVTNTRRWPLMTDPQNQANSWIKKMEKDNGLNVVRATDEHLMRTVENSMRMGVPVLLEHAGETINAALRPVIARQIFKVQSRLVIRLGDVDVDYNPNFKLYCTCNIPNPQYAPEIYSMMTVVNFAVTRQDLGEQLLTAVVRCEQPKLEAQKDELTLQINADQTKLSKTEDDILEMLKSASGNILDDETLITHLDGAKTTSEQVAQSLIVAEETSKKINAAREQYRTVAARGSVLFFAIKQMAAVNVLYQHSLGFFRKSFVDCIQSTPEADSPRQRIQALETFMMNTIFGNVCRGIYQKDKLLFAFMITVQTLKDQQLVTDDEWKFSMAGAAQGGASIPNMCSTWLPDAAWVNVQGLAQLPGLGQLTSSIGAEDTAAWEAYYKEPNVHQLPLPAAWTSSLRPFQTLLVQKTLREDRLVLLLTKFVAEQLGRQFVEPAAPTLASSFADSSATVPIIFVLSQAADPTQSLLEFAAEKDVEGNLEIISLGRGQGPRAEKLIEKAREDGSWVCLQNCHLAASWMPTLEALVEDLAANKGHDDFRLWLTTYPSPCFPIPVVQSSVKLTTELPSGVRANLMRTYEQLPEESFKGVAGTKRRLLFGLAFFHATVQERCTFGPVGFNTPYEWTNADLQVSIKMLNSELEGTLFDTLHYMIGRVHYGGRVTDIFDQRCMQCLLEKFLHRDVDAEHTFDDAGLYFVPEVKTKEESLAYIRALPLIDNPSIFGLHDSADVTRRLKSSQALMAAIVQASDLASAGASSSLDEDNATVTAVVAQLLMQVPDQLPQDDKRAAAEISADPLRRGSLDPLRTALAQEMVRYNGLHDVIRSSLSSLQQAINGYAVMSDSLQAVYRSLLYQAVPELWLNALGVRSLKSLAAWMQTLDQNVEELWRWHMGGPPISYFLPGLCFPQGLLAAVKQLHARAHGVAIDTLRLHTQPTLVDDPEGLARVLGGKSFPGIYVHGLWLDAGRWVPGSGVVADPVTAHARPQRMPVMWVWPVTLRDNGSPTPSTPASNTPGPDGSVAGSMKAGSMKVGSMSSKMGLEFDGMATATSSAGGFGSSPKAMCSSASSIGSISPKADKAMGGTTKSGLSEKSRASPIGRAVEEDDEIAELTENAEPAASRAPKVGGGRSSPYEMSPLGTPLPPVGQLIYPPPEDSYTCPVYKTAARGAEGWVLNCELGSLLSPKHWVMRGTAMLCEPP